MANGEISVAGAALAVALTALVIAVAQLLQQVFSTAEGYRRCQPSVLGPWAKRTRLSWRWSQFRFEVKFTTPELVLRPGIKSNLAVTKWDNNAKRQPTFGFLGQNEVFHIDHTGQNANKEMISELGGRSTDLVGWINFMKQLEILDVTVIKDIENVEKSSPVNTARHLISRPGWRAREWSWDFMPPDIVRPLATTTVGTLVVMAHRLGMVWRDLRPSEGMLRAEGNGHSLSATFSRGFGLLVQYSYDENYVQSDNRSCKSDRIPTDAADKLACGIIPGFRPFDLEDIPLVPIQDTIAAPKKPSSYSLPASSLTFIASSLKSIGIRQEGNVVRAVTDRSDALYLVSELRSLWCPFLPTYNYPVVKVFNAIRADVEHFAHREARLVFQARIHQYLEHPENQSPQLSRLRDQLDTCREKWRFFFDNSNLESHDAAEQPPTDLIEFAHYVWDETTTYFKHFEEKYHGRLRYKELVLAHLHQSAATLERITQEKENRKHRMRDQGAEIVWRPRSDDFTDRFMRYTENEQLDLFVAILEENMKHKVNNNTKSEERFIADKKELVEAWWTLMVRGIFFSCTLRYLTYTEYPAVSSAFYGSRMPVYIT